MSGNDDIFEAMEEKYGSAFVQDVRDRLAVCESREIQYLEMKQMNEIMFRFRERLRGIVDLYRGWQAEYHRETDTVERVYKSYEGQFIRRQLNDAWRLYLTANKDYHEMYRAYMGQIQEKTQAGYVSFPASYSSGKKAA